ncbi:MAG: GNAT family N-acetyltransferase [Myxococcota bacterium]
MEIRRAVPADGPAFLALVHALAEFENLPPPDSEAGGRLLKDAFADPPRFALWVVPRAAVQNGASASASDGDGSDTQELPPLVAYAVTFATYSTFLARPTLYLEDLFVHPAARRRGIATALLAFLRKRAIEQGCGRMDWSVLDWNRGALALYSKLGAEYMSSWQLMRIDLP